MTCQHNQIQTYRLDDGTPVMWACADCKHKFEPLKAENPCTYPDCNYPCMNLPDCIAELAEQESLKIGCVNHDCGFCQPKREWVGLTDEEYTELWGMKPDLLNFFRKIEAKLKEKNT